MNRPYTTIIIDDEPPARERLLQLLGNFPDVFQVIDVAKDGIDAQEKIESLKPDLIFLDIEMPGLSGFEMLSRLKKIPMVIFCTAYDQYSLKAFETNSIDYLLKPVSLERLQKSVNKLKLFSENHASQNILKLLQELSAKKEVKKMTSITVKKGDKLIFIKLEDVSHFKADERLVAVQSKSGDYITDQSLSVFETKLPDNFLRIHRGIIVNTNYIKEVNKYFNSRFVFTLSDEMQTKLTSGRSYNVKIKEFLQ